MDPLICERLAYRQQRERHPHPATVVSRELLASESLGAPFDVVTIIGSTLTEIGDRDAALDACIALLSVGGILSCAEIPAGNSEQGIARYLAAGGHEILREELIAVDTGVALEVAIARRR